MTESPGGEDDRIFFPPSKAGDNRWARLHKPFGMLLPFNLLAHRKAIEALEIPHQSSPTSSWVTANVGIASVVPQHNGPPSELVAKADRALYDAKQSGRNRIALRD